MKVAQLLESRRDNWRELERLCFQLESRRWRRIGPTSLGRFASLYRSVCADLALAEAYRLPQSTVQYLHNLVARAHNQLYRSRTFNLASWSNEMFRNVPQRLFRDGYLRLSAVIFYGLFLLSMFMAYNSPKFAEDIIGEEMIVMMEQMHSESVSGRDSVTSSAMFGFYINHNTTIGLRCFAYGVVFGVAGLFVLASNAISLGAVFGHMANSPHSENFYQFVTAHGPFELTAIVLSAAAGMKLGFSLVTTGGLTRAASIRRAAVEAVPTVCAAVVLFGGAALIEGFLSPSAAPYAVKAAVGAMSAGLLMFYFVGLGWDPGATDATG